MYINITFFTKNIPFSDQYIVYHICEKISIADHGFRGNKRKIFSGDMLTGVHSYATMYTNKGSMVQTMHTLPKRRLHMRYSDFTPEHERAFIEFTRGGAAAALIYSPNVLADGKVCRLDDGDASVRTFAVNGVIFVPIVFFTRFFAVEKDGNRLIRGGASYMSEDGKSVPVLEAAQALGFSAKAYCDRRFIVV